jgi:tetratricopeptide (TPR) repeat protein
LNRAPFLKQARNGLSSKNLDARIKELAPRSPEDLQTIARQYLVAIEAHPNDPAIRLNYATFLLSHNQAENAKAHCRKAITLSPWNPSSHYTLGLALAGTNSPTSARKHLETALTLHPTHHLSHTLLGNMLANDEPAKALKHLQISLRIEPDDARTLLTLANLRLAATEKDLRDPKEAFDLALRACSVSDYANPAAVGMLIEAARQSSRKTEAKAAIETAIPKATDPTQKAGLQQALEGL